MATVILLDGLPRTYEVCVEMNSTVSQGELVGYFREVGTEEAEPCVVERDGNSLSVSVTLDGLQSAKEIQYSISATWEKWSGSELIAIEFGNAPPHYGNNARSEIVQSICGSEKNLAFKVYFYSIVLFLSSALVIK